MFKHWFSQGVAVWIVTATVATAGGALLTYLQLHSSEWARPLMFGFVGFCAIFLVGVSIRISLTMPKKEPHVTVKNIQTELREWLDRMRVAVTSNPQPETFFRFDIRMSGKTFLIGRSRLDHADKLIIRSEIVHKDNVPQGIVKSQPDEVQRLANMIRLELARQKVGYMGLTFPVAETFAIQQSISIDERLTEKVFLRTLFDVEAATNAVLALYELWLESSKADKSVIVKQ